MESVPKTSAEYRAWPTNAAQYRAWWATQTSVPFGFCWCGCGARTNPHRSFNMAARLAFRGEPMRYLRGHVRRKSPVDYRVDPNTGCWIWLRTQIKAPNGTYGQMWADGRRQPAYRVYYEREHGPVPPKWDVHHVCVEEGYGTTLCVNPAHMEALSRSEHLLRHARLRRSRNEVSVD